MNAFKIADEYIQLRKKIFVPTTAGTILRINDMILTPLILICLCLLGQSQSAITLLGPFFTAFKSWREWEQFHTLQDTMMRMFVYTMITGGPRITTNDPTYIPYVFADAVMRPVLPQHMEQDLRVRQHLFP